MSQDERHSHKQGRKHESRNDETLQGFGLHKDWRFWVAVGLMIAAIVAYVLSMDESMQPGGNAAPKQPAAGP